MAEGAIGVPRGTAQSAARAEVSASKARMLYIDNMRVGLITLVIVGHMAITYGAPVGDWYYHEQGEVGTVFAVLVMLLLGIGASFLLGLFFMISGYFTPGPYDRKGPGAFVADRLKRLGIPLVFYAVFINPLVTYWAAVHGGYEGSLQEYVPTHVPELTKASISVLWFVEALLFFSIVYALVRLLTKAGGAQEEARFAPVPSNRSVVLFAMLLGVATFVVRIWAPMWWWWEPLHQEPGHFPQYAGFFVVGLFAYRHSWFTRISVAQVRPWRWAALALVPLFPVLAVAAGALSGEMDPAVTGGLTWLSLAYSLWEGFMGTAMVIVVLVGCRDHFERQGRLMRSMSAASYAVYVLHPLLIVPLAIALSGIRLDLSLKFLLVAPVAVALCFLVAHLVRKLPVVRGIL
jgi:fucose 4-O-acetylase-like acetyltransferase